MRLQSSLGDVISPALGGHSDNLTGSLRSTDCHNSQELLITISSLRGWLNGLVLDSVEVPPACPLAASACWEGPLEQDNMLILIILFSFCVSYVCRAPYHDTLHTTHYTTTPTTPHCRISFKLLPGLTGVLSSLYHWDTDISLKFQWEANNVWRRFCVRSHEIGWKICY